jgi:hypothetical protein
VFGLGNVLAANVEHSDSNGNPGITDDNGTFVRIVWGSFWGP